MKSSLAFKWSVTLLLSSLTGVILVGLFAYRTTLNEYDRLRVNQAQTTFVDQVTTYYEENQAWDGVDEQFRDAGRPYRPQQGRPQSQSFALADNRGIVVVESGPFHEGDRVNSTQIDEGVPITVDDTRVGTVLLAMPPPDLDPREQNYLASTNRALLIGAVGASAIALLVGIILSQQFLRPLADLTRAISAMRQGDLDQQVEVRTNDELGELASTFNQMSAEIHRANQLRQRMTADIAHDLRTPLLVITGYLEALVDGTLQPTPARFKTMQDEAMLLKRLVEDLRTLSLADAGELKLIYQSVAPRELLEQVKQSFEPIAEQQRVTLVVQVDDNVPEIRVDRERMVQVLGNLVTNALRYTPEGGRVTLSASREGEFVRLSVQDTGAGIAADKLPNIFERFYRTEESRSENESGLGLAIARSIVEAHHGKIHAESKVGVGTNLMITLRPASAKDG